MKEETISVPLRKLVKVHFAKCYSKIEEVTDTDCQWGMVGQPSNFMFGVYGKLYFRLINDTRNGLCLFRLIGNGNVTTDGRSKFWNVDGATNFEEAKFESIRKRLEANGMYISENDSYFSEG